MVPIGEVQSSRWRSWLRPLVLAVVAGLLGLGIGYARWNWPHDWYRARDVGALPPSPENDLIRYGAQLIADTAAHIGSTAPDPALRYAGNDLACTNCHMNSGLKAFAAPFVSTFSSFPMPVNDAVITLRDRVNGCMRRSMNGRAMPPSGREMEAMIAYIRFVGVGSPQGVRIPGMGLPRMEEPGQPPDERRGAQLYAQQCANCHRPEGEGHRLVAPAIGYAIPPLWGDGSFNAAAGMSKLETAAAFIYGNMPLGADATLPLLTAQQAWDVAKFVTTRPRPPSP